MTWKVISEHISKITIEKNAVYILTRKSQKVKAVVSFCVGGGLLLRRPRYLKLRLLTECQNRKFRGDKTILAAQGHLVPWCFRPNSSTGWWNKASRVHRELLFSMQSYLP